MEKIFLEVLNMSLTASILVMVVLLVRLLLRKAPKWISCLLWAIVAVRLVCPVSVESMFSLVPSQEPIPENIAEMQNPEITTGIPIINNTVNPVMANTLTPEPGTSANPMQIVLAIASRVWMIGIIILFAYAVISYLILYKTVRESVLFFGRVKICDHIETPFILGVLNPYIYIPSGISGEQLGYVMAHENAHLKRLDHLWKPLGFLILTMHWFNPLVWIAYILFCKDIEMACDEKVIRDMERKEAASYSQTLLECSLERRNILKCPLAFGEVSVKERIKHVLNFKKPAIWIVFIAVLSCIIVAVCFLTNPKKDTYQNKITVSAKEELQLNQTENSVTDLESAIKQSIIENGSANAPSSSVSEYKVASFVELGRFVTDGAVEEICVFGMAMYMEANVTEDGIQETSGSHMPVALTYEIVDGNYTLKEYWEPGEGSYYVDSIREKFPEKIADDAIDTQATVYRQTMDCYDQIIRQSDVDTEEVINKLLMKICKPDISSNTYDYIKNSPIEFRELIYYGQYTLNFRDKYAKEPQSLYSAVIDEACNQIEEIIGGGKGKNEVYTYGNKR